MYIYGGKPKSGRITSDVWAYNFAEESWNQLFSAAGSRSRSSSASAASSSNERGTAAGAGAGAVAASASFPPPREMLVAEILGDGMVIFGGVRGSSIYGDGWYYEFKTNSWVELTRSEAGKQIKVAGDWPGPRYGSASINAGHRKVRTTTNGCTQAHTQMLMLMANANANSNSD
jgi:hypothetical protein